MLSSGKDVVVVIIFQRFRKFPTLASPAPAMKAVKKAAVKKAVVKKVAFTKRAHSKANHISNVVLESRTWFYTI